MNQHRFLLLVIAVSCMTLTSWAQAGPSCADLANLKLDGVEITNAVSVPAGATIPASYPHYAGTLPAHCRVEGDIHRRKGVGGEEFGIGFAVALPANDAWNGDFMMQGGGGGNGVINYPVGAGYAGNKPALDRGSSGPACRAATPPSRPTAREGAAR